MRLTQRGALLLGVRCAPMGGLARQATKRFDAKKVHRAHFRLLFEAGGMLHGADATVNDRPPPA